MIKDTLVVALAGNPNSGKTTLFNELTGARQHVGNYPGVTVERKEGFRRHGSINLRIVDLPGTYSLTAYSAEELVARNFIVDEKPDVVVDILDASNLERNLYLAVQLRELGVPLVLAFNMADMAKARGFSFDIVRLSRQFGAPIVETVGHKGEGLNALLDAVVACASAPYETSLNAENHSDSWMHYGPVIEAELDKVQTVLTATRSVNGFGPSRWIAAKLLENDKELFGRITAEAVKKQVSLSSARIEESLGEHPETALASRRYGFIGDICQASVRSSIEARRTLSDRIDAVVTHRLLGLPIFFGLMYLVFQLTFTLGDPPMGWIESLFGFLGDWLSSWWPEDSESLLKSLLVDGIIGGVGGVVVFLPNILLLFMAIALLEDSGYMARVAFIMDRLMRKIGLHGKSFIPLLIGFGCSVPAIMATRTLENRRDRITTMLIAPLMSCGARLPIYALIIPAFFPEVWHAPMLWLIYIIGIALAIISAKILRMTVLKGSAVPFVMELPPYRIPTLKGVLIHMGERGWLYLKKAGTVILGISILLWAMTTFPGISEEKAARFEQARATVSSGAATEEEKEEQLAGIDNEEAEAALQDSAAGRIGRFFEPALRPMGFDWRIGTAMIGAFAAKEVFVAQMGIVYAVGEADEESDSLREQLRDHYSPLTAFCIMIFCLVSAPCMATIAVTRRESGSWGWAFFQLGGLTALAYVLTALIYQAGRLFGIGVV